MSGKEQALNSLISARSFTARYTHSAGTASLSYGVVVLRSITQKQGTGGRVITTQPKGQIIRPSAYEVFVFFLFLRRSF